MTEKVIEKIIVDVAHQIHKRWGPDLAASVYEVILAYALNGRGMGFSSILGLC